jgi:acyl carrier protein
MNPNTDIESELRRFIAKNLVFSDEDYSLPDEASFLAHGVVDSMGVMELLEHVSQQYGFEVPLEDITPANFDSITRLAGYIRRRLAEASAAPSPQLAGSDAVPATVNPQSQ